MTRTVKKQMLVWGSVFLLLVGLTLHIRQMLFMASALAVLSPLAYLMSRPLLRGLEVRRRAPDRLNARETCMVSLIVSNPTVRSRPAFWVEDTLPEGLSADDASQLVLDLGPGEERRLHYRLQALRRGVFPLGPIRLFTTDALGLHEFEQLVPEMTELLVYPRVVPLPDLWPQGPAERSTPRRTQRRPGGVDPRGTREYTPGDDLRHIHWKVSAHRNKLILVEREQSEGLRATAVVDLSEGVHTGRGNETSLECAVTIAASLLVQGLERGGTVGLIACGDRDYSVPGDSAPHHRWRLLEALARCQAGCPRPLSEVMREHLARLPRGSSVAVITPQLGEEVLTTAGLLATRGLRGLWFLLVAPTFELETHGGLTLDGRYQALAEALTRRGQRAYVIRAGESLESVLGRWLRAAG